MQDILQRIYDYSLEDIMGDRFGRYSKTIIQDRALPDVRDGLKPVQRRILYAMYKERNTHDREYRKAAQAVGNVMGKFHPHGDSSIYDAMVRMSQWWKQNEILIDMHGNNGSMDGDSPAAMRYTEARLSKISEEFLRDIDKKTIAWAPNYDDTILEPTVLPSRFPNLLVNGSTGISAGYATNIPPHNLIEVIDATIKRLESPNCHMETILDIVKGPDFPTGGIVYGEKGIHEAYKTGRGRIIIRAKTHFEKDKGKEKIVITEIPYDVNKANLVKKIDDIRIDKKIDGILEVRDETDREGLRIAIDIRKDADKDLILNYLFKNTDMQISYNFNMVAIVNRRPKLLGILDILDAYIAHQKEVVTRRTEFDLNHAKNRMHIVEGLMKAISILDDVIATIRSSQNKADSIKNLIEKFGFTELQADAIVTLQLYRLTNFDILALQDENKNLEVIIKGLTEILENPEKLVKVIKEELNKIKKEYGKERITQIESEIEDIKIDNTVMIPKEDCVVVVTNEGYVKRVPIRSYSASEGDPTLKEGDFVIGMYEMNTLDTLLLFTDKGNFLYIPVHELPELKWKELGKHVSNIITLDASENVIGSIPVYNFEENKYVLLTTKNGMIKKTKLSEFKMQRYSKPVVCMRLKDNDSVVSIALIDESEEIIIVTQNGYSLRYSANEVATSGLKTSGVIAASLKDDFIVSSIRANDGNFLTVFTDKGTAKRIKIEEISNTARARKGNSIIRDVKSNPYKILKAYVLDGKANVKVMTKDKVIDVKVTEIPISDLSSTGTQITKDKLLHVFLEKNLEEKEKIKMKTNLDEIDSKIEKIDFDDIESLIIELEEQ